MNEPTGIYNNASGLYGAINNALGYVTVSAGWRDINPVTGEIDGLSALYPFNPTDLNEKYEFPTSAHPYGVQINDYSGRGIPPKPTFQESYTDEHWTGTEHMFNITSNETLSYVVEHAQVAMKPRMDKLEEDFNSLVATIAAVGATLRGLSTSAVTNLRTGWGSVSGTGGYRYINHLAWDTIEVVETNTMAGLFDLIQEAAGGVTRHTTATEYFKDKYEVISENGSDFVVHIR